MITTDIYIEPIHRDNPVGNNIEYDDKYLLLINSLQEKPEQQFGDVIIEAQSQDWDNIFNLSSDILLEKSKDLTVMSIFSQSAIYCKGLIGLYNGLDIIYQNLNLYWDDIFPQLYDDDEYDPEYRVNSLSLFNAYDGIIKAIRSCFFIKNGLSQNSFTVKEIESFLDNYNPDDESYPGGIDRLNIDLQIAMSKDQSEINFLLESLKLIEKIEILFEKNINDSLLKLDNLKDLLKKFKKISEVEQLANHVHEESSVHKEAIISVSPNLNWANYQIKTRQDVDILLEKIFIYFEKNEPSHPAPLFIRRIQRLMNCNFYEIIRDISPEALDKLENLVGQPFDNTTNDYD